MPNIQLPTGKTIYIPIQTFLFDIKDDEIDLFYQTCIADDLGTFVEDPFSQRGMKGDVKVNETEETVPEEPTENIE